MVERKGLQSYKLHLLNNNKYRYFISKVKEYKYQLIKLGKYASKFNSKTNML